MALSAVHCSVVHLVGHQFPNLLNRTDDNYLIELL